MRKFLKNSGDRSRRSIRRALLLAVLLAGGPVAAQEIVVDEALIPAGPPGARASAAYVTLRNTGGSDRLLVGVEAEGFGAVRLHWSVDEDGLMRMEPVAEVPVPAGGTLAMTPGGLHVMLMGPEAPLEPGQTVPLTLIFRDGERLSVTAEVQPRDGQADAAE